MNKVLTLLLTVLVVSQMLSWYWILEFNDDRGNYRTLEERTKKNTTFLISTLQRKILNIEKRLNIVSQEQEADTELSVEEGQEEAPSTE